MGHDYVRFAGRTALFRDPELNLVQRVMLTVAERSRQTDDFSERLAEHVRDFYWITNGVFSDLRLDELLATANDVVAFLSSKLSFARFGIRS